MPRTATRGRIATTRTTTTRRRRLGPTQVMMRRNDRGRGKNDGWRHRDARCVRCAARREDASSPSSSSSSSSSSDAQGRWRETISATATRARDTLDAAGARYDWASAFAGSVLCAACFVARGQRVDTACGIVFMATIAAVVAEELLKDVERDGGGRR